eukprot:TRINITY_DN23043_c0_g1_i1.p1 TRINITY_DN23043_c0_g1~~TRINITY_DN23043_c0_g1_i1.p1  ORF type:complete len:304 (+),score=34.34 TRINITY_DN23043_c0_g1_i1:56-967(+)
MFRWRHAAVAWYMNLPLILGALWQRRVLDLSSYPLATCLDGSPGLYYIRLGNELTKFFVVMEGGGWCDMGSGRNCSMVQSCYDRSFNYLGSSKYEMEPCCLRWATKQYLSSRRSVNPAFHNWTMVYLRYCDGASFSGLRSEGIDVDGRRLFFRGNYIMQAVIQDLVAYSGLAHASHVVVGGNSAGGLATYLHAHQWRAALPRATSVAAMPDSGFFEQWHVSTPAGCSMPYEQAMRGIFIISNASGGLPPACLRSYAEEDAWQCMFAKNAALHIGSPCTTHGKRTTWRVLHGTERHGTDSPLRL